MGPAKDTEEVGIDGISSSHKIKIGTLLNPKVHEVVISCLRRNRDVFAWSYNDMKGIDPKLICH